MATIMVVDDERGLRDLLRRTLEAVGHRVIEASDGNQAIAMFRRATA